MASQTPDELWPNVSLLMATGTRSMAEPTKNPHPTFSVDTHLFRELGELLVGRDSTALIELIKNCYDADATEVVVYGETLSDPEHGFIAIRDNGTGMSRSDFEQGFLRIASRTKELGPRRSAIFQRRYTGAKGIGRLAAHKLAHSIEVNSLRWNGEKKHGKALRASDGVEAVIRWDIVESHATLETLAGSDAVTVREVSPEADASAGTTITLRHLRTGWSKSAQSRFLDEIQTFGPSGVLTEPLPRQIVQKRLLFDQPLLRDGKKIGADAFTVKLEGELAPSDSFFQAKIESATWVLEIDAFEGTGQVRYGIAPTRETSAELPDAHRKEFTIAHPTPSTGPFFQSRILLRTGRAWEGRTSGVRVFLEGFRILPYGESRNDWLGLDRDATERGRGTFLSRRPAEPLGELLAEEEASKDEGLLVLPNKHYFGGVFLTQGGARHLRMLVNREGFVPDTVYETLVTLVRGGIDLATRIRAAASEQERGRRRQERAKGRRPSDEEAPVTRTMRASIAQASSAAGEARRFIASGDVSRASDKIAEAVAHLTDAEAASTDIVGELAMLRVLASVGTQMSAFVHEINGLVGTAESVDNALRNLRDKSKNAGRTSRDQSDALTVLAKSMGDLRRNLDRQASYLVDVVTLDARRRRARLAFAERFDAATRLVSHAAETRGIRIENRIQRDLKSPPMFPAELTTVFSNLLTNAVKAAGNGGRIHASARVGPVGVDLRVENTGVAVDPSLGERWFRPFESSTASVDAALGQGMGLGLSITRSVLAEYGGTIKFAKPSPGFATAVEIYLPSKR